MADANLANLKNGARPEQITAAQAQVDAAQANLDTTKANVDSAKARADGSKSQAVSAKAQVDAAQAALNAIEVQIAKMTITAPADGVVLSRSIEPGEVASPGASLLTLGQLGKLTITVYIPEDRYGEINLGEAATVTVDSFPGEKFTATVTHIADKAEFTPRNVQTAEGRRTTVFAVKLSIDNADSKLKPGMPADVAFGK
jgi:RND family efflux transporter MFP subunit